MVDTINLKTQLGFNLCKTIPSKVLRELGINNGTWFTNNWNIIDILNRYRQHILQSKTRLFAECRFKILQFGLSLTDLFLYIDITTSVNQQPSGFCVPVLCSKMESSFAILDKKKHITILAKY